MSANVTATIDSGSIKNVDINASAEITRSKLALETKQQSIKKESLRIFDSATNAVLPNAAAGDDLGFVARWEPTRTAYRPATQRPRASRRKRGSR